MNRSATMTKGKQLIAGTVFQISRRLVMIRAVTLGITLPAIAQNPEIQRSLLP